MNETNPTEDGAFARVPTGIAGLDTMLGGGLMRGGIYIVQGNPGAGKTILTNQICFHHLATLEGSQALFVTLLAENHARMMGHLRGLAFFDESRIPDRLTYLSAFSELREGGLKAVVALIRREIQRRRCTLLILDGLVSVETSAASPHAFKEFVHDLQEIALATDCTMIMTTNSGTRQNSPEQTMVDGLIGLNDRGYGWRSESDIQILKFRGSGFLRGRHAYKITDGGIVVHPRIEALYARPSLEPETYSGVKRVKSGIARLDAMLGGGLPTASTTMVMGPSGVGKTTLGIQFLSGSHPAERGLLFGFYETPARIRAKAEQICKPLVALIEAGDVEVLWQPPTDDLLDAYGERLLEAVHRRKVRRLFIDGLQGFQKAAVEPARMDHFFTALSNELRVLGVTTLYSLEVPDILGPAIRIPLDDISSIAENMVLMRFMEVRSRLYRLISILKVRDSGFDPNLHEYVLTNEGLLIEETSDSAEAITSDAGRDQKGADRPGVKVTRDKRGA